MKNKRYYTNTDLRQHSRDQQVAKFILPIPAESFKKTSNKTFINLHYNVLIVNYLEKIKLRYHYFREYSKNRLRRSRIYIVLLESNALYRRTSVIMFVLTLCIDNNE